MLRVFSVVLFTVLSFTACKKEDKPKKASANCFVQKGFNDGKIIEGEYIVFFKNAPLNQKIAVDPNNARKVLNALNLKPQKELAAVTGGIKGYLLKLDAEELQAIQNNKAVQSVEPDRIIALSACFQVVAPTLITWGAKRVGYGDGKGKTAWVLDTGIDFEHPDLNVDVARSRSFVTGVATADDDNGHGTHVAGIIGAKNNNIGILGVASGANLVALKVLDKEGNGKLSQVIEALNYIASAAKPGDVVNMSLGEEGISDYLDHLVTNMSNRGILFSIAAGNDSKPAINYSPGRVNTPNIFTVSAMDSLDVFASFSNYGNEAVDVAAPGVRIISTYKDGNYARLSGTSMAAPHVAGLLLLNGNKINKSGTVLNDPDGVADPIAHK